MAPGYCNMNTINRIMVPKGGKDSMNVKKKNDFVDIGIMLYLYI